jgi:hypothetical protein
MPNFTPNYNLIIPQIGDNVASDIQEIGNSNQTIDSTLKSLSDTDTTLDTKIDNNFNILDIKIDTQDDLINGRIDQLILHSSPLPEVAAQQVYDACYSNVTGITYPVLGARLDAMEQDVIDVQQVVADFVENYAMLLRLGGIG